MTPKTTYNHPRPPNTVVKVVKEHCRKSKKPKPTQPDRRQLRLLQQNRHRSKSQNQEALHAIGEIADWLPPSYSGIRKSPARLGAGDTLILPRQSGFYYVDEGGGAQGQGVVVEVIAWIMHLAAAFARSVADVEIGARHLA